MVVCDDKTLIRNETPRSTANAANGIGQGRGCRIEDVVCCNCEAGRCEVNMTQHVHGPLSFVALDVHGNGASQQSEADECDESIAQHDSEISSVVSCPLTGGHCPMFRTSCQRRSISGEEGWKRVCESAVVVDRVVDFALRAAADGGDDPATA